MYDSVIMLLFIIRLLYAQPDVTWTFSVNSSEGFPAQTFRNILNTEYRSDV
jgi:hypothetical protein